MPSNHPINQELIEARIREINDAIQNIHTLTSKNFKLLTLPEQLAIRYLVIQLIEASASICLHLLATQYNERAEGFPDCFTRLGSKGVLSKSLASSLAAAARLRNLLVHRYWSIDDKRVYQSAKAGSSDFSKFIEKIRQIVMEAKK